MHTTPLPPADWRVTDVERLSPCSRRALLRALGLRHGEEVLGDPVFLDLCVCEVVQAALLEAAYEWACERCGARIPLALYCGPPARIYVALEDWGALAAWYFRAVERLHG